MEGRQSPSSQTSSARLPMNMAEYFRREAREFLAYSRLWLRNVKALSWWVVTWDKEKAQECWALRGTNYPATLPKARNGDPVRSQALAPCLLNFSATHPGLCLRPPEARPHLL